MFSIANQPKYTNEQIEELARELLHRRRCLEDLDYWAETAIKTYTPPGKELYVPARHHKLLLSYLKRVDKGEIDHLMVFMPPSSAKSLYIGPVFTSWEMARNPKLRVIATSATNDLVIDLSRKTQSLMREFSTVLDVRPVHDNSEYWFTSNRSSYKAVSIERPVTGFRGDLIIVDDPVKDAKEAESELVRNNTHTWFKSVLYNRHDGPGQPTIIIQTRWHEDDLSGRLLGEMGRKEEGGKWTVLSLPAVWEEDYPDELGRLRGDVLWPEHHTKEYVEDIRKLYGIREFASLYQQNPRPVGGSLFKTDMLKYEEAYNLSGKLIRAWDLAATAQVGSKNPDWTVGVLMQLKDDMTIWVLDVVRFREGPEKVREIIKNTADKDGWKVKISIPQDPGAGGKYQSLDLVQRLAGYQVETSPESGDKATRASSFAAQVNVGNVTVLKRPWTAAFVDELQGFPGLKFDDQVDACSRAMAGLTMIGPAPAVIDYPFMMR